MKATTSLLLATQTIALLVEPAAAEDWNAPQQPFSVYGNTYYVGVHALSSVLITSDARETLNN
jgi:metallo-beta-lactamase class B